MGENVRTRVSQQTPCHQLLSSQQCNPPCRIAQLHWLIGICVSPSSHCLTARCVLVNKPHPHVTKTAICEAVSATCHATSHGRPCSCIAQPQNHISKVSFDLKYLEKGLFAFKRPQRQLRQYR